MSDRQVAIAITGASGAIYGVRLVEELLRAGVAVSLVITAAGSVVLREECALQWEGEPSSVLERVRERVGNGRLAVYGEKDLFAPIASGSRAADAMVVVPCSMGTLSRIAAGNSANLVERAADVMLKEGRPLLLVPRETPLNAIHLENMLKLARLGARIIPAMPAFYQHPSSLDDLVNFVVGKVLDALGVEHALFRRWGD